MFIAEDLKKNDSLFDLIFYVIHCEIWYNEKKYEYSLLDWIGQLMVCLDEYVLVILLRFGNMRKISV